LSVTSSAARIEIVIPKERYSNSGKMRVQSKEGIKGNIISNLRNYPWR